jgi:hypothetical protein
MSNNRVFSNNNNKPWTKEELIRKIEQIDTKPFVEELLKAVRSAGIDFTDATIAFEGRRATDGEIFLTLTAMFIKPDKKPDFNFRFKL